jgi:hypothetical protein
MGERKENILTHSNAIGTALGLQLTGKEYSLDAYGRADNHCRLNESLLFLVEIEMSQRHPEMNVLKVWPYLQNHEDQNIILVQHIIDRTSVSPNRLLLCHWLNDEMAKTLASRFRYHLIIGEVSQNDIAAIKESIKEFNP